MVCSLCFHNGGEEICSALFRPFVRRRCLFLCCFAISVNLAGLHNLHVRSYCGESSEPLCKTYGLRLGWVLWVDRRRYHHRSFLLSPSSSITCHLNGPVCHAIRPCVLPFSKIPMNPGGYVLPRGRRTVCLCEGLAHGTG